MRMTSVSENRFVDFDDQTQFLATAPHPHLTHHRHVGRCNPKTTIHFKV